MKVREFTLPNSPFLSETKHWIEGANHGYSEACKDHQSLLDACQALYDHFLTTGGKEDSLLGIQVKEALKKARNE